MRLVRTFRRHGRACPGHPRLKNARRGCPAHKGVHARLSTGYGRARRMSVSRCFPARSKLHARRLLELRPALAQIEERAVMEAEHRGEQRRRELLDPGVVFLDRVVEKAARGS